jgi:hypothetical protein
VLFNHLDLDRELKVTCGVLGLVSGVFNYNVKITKYSQNSKLHRVIVHNLQLEHPCPKLARIIATRSLRRVVLGNPVACLLLLLAELRARINFFQKMMISLEHSYLPQLLVFSLDFTTIVLVYDARTRMDP